MKFYTKRHKHYCGINLHTKTMFICIIDNKANILIHKNIPVKGRFLELIAFYREDLIVDVECMFSWYWLADLCEQNNVDGVCALYESHSCGKIKSDKID